MNRDIKKKGPAHNMKRFLASAILMVLFIFGVAFALETADGFQYSVENDGSITISGYSGQEANIIIPGEVEGRHVKYIGNGAFANNESITNVTVSEGIESIGNGVFSFCSNLANIELPDSLISIGKGAFEQCSSLSSIRVPEGITVIDDKTFYYASLIEVVLPTSLRSIGDSAFVGNAYEKIILPDGLEKIAKYGFSSNHNLEELIIPNTVRDIGVAAFAMNPKLRSIIFPSGMSRLRGAFLFSCPKLQIVAIPKSVTSIDATNMFDGSYLLNIWGFKGSEAEKFAKKNNIPFEVVDPVQQVRILLSNEDITKSMIFIDLNTDTSTLKLTSQTTPNNPWPGVIWKSSDAKTVSVDTNGLVTGLKKGKATLTATAVDGSGKKATCEIMVARLAKKILINGVNSLQAGKKTTLIVEVHPDLTDTKAVVWSTSDKSIATVDAKGIVTAKKVIEEKAVTITATAKDGSGIIADFVIVILP